MVVLAHPTHWLTSVLYALPMVGLIGFFIFTKIRDARLRRSESPAADDHEIAPQPSDP